LPFPGQEFNVAAKKSTRHWLRRHVRDPYVREATAQGYRSRAALKLIQIDASDGIFKNARKVIDLGAAPGGWTQVAAARIGPQGRLVAVDLLPIEPVHNATIVQGDFLQPAIRAEITALLSGPADLVLSDLAPNLTGVRDRDQALVLEIGLLALAFAAQALKSGGILVVKVFQGQALAQLQQVMQQDFAPIRVRKPPASRDRSTEIYLIGYKR